MAKTSFLAKKTGLLCTFSSLLLKDHLFKNRYSAKGNRECSLNLHCKIFSLLFHWHTFSNTSDFSTSISDNFRDLLFILPKISFKFA